LASFACVWHRRFVAARVASAAAVTAVLWGWAVAQYPDLLPGQLTIADAAAAPVTLRAVLVSLAVGAVLVVPPLVALFAVAQREAEQD
jgi:cytochrome d ubiquinol oxidase subunit II